MRKLQLKEKIIQLSIKHSITSEYTSFLAIEDRDEAEKAHKFALSTQSSIQDLLSSDPDACEIDCLPYMDYATDETKIASTDLVELSHRLDTNLAKLFATIDYETMSESDRNTLYDFLVKNQENIKSSLSAG